MSHRLPPVAVTATQSAYPWRATVRTVFQFVVSLAAVLPLLVLALGVDATGPVVAAVLGFAAGLTRLMASPVVEAFLQTWAPWLAAEPSATRR